jgi:hypothetical protein
VNLERFDQPLRDGGHVATAWLNTSSFTREGRVPYTEFSDELKSRSADLVVGGGRLEVGEGLDVATHRDGSDSRLGQYAVESGKARLPNGGTVRTARLPNARLPNNAAAERRDCQAAHGRFAPFGRHVRVLSLNVAVLLGDAR